MNKSPNGYLRQSNYFYMPAMVEYRWSSGSWTLSATGELDILLKGVQYSRFSDITPAYNNLTNVQNKGLGVRLSAKVNKDFGGIGAFVEPFWRFWDIEESDANLLYYNGIPDEYMCEPHNTTNEYGLRVGISF